MIVEDPNEKLLSARQVLSNQQSIMQALLAIIEDDDESGKRHVARNLRADLVETQKLLGRSR